jgi:hypothetical protein
LLDQLAERIVALETNVEKPVATSQPRQFAATIAVRVSD